MAGAVNAATIYDLNQSPSLIDTRTAGVPDNGTQLNAVTPGALYSNNTTFSGFGVSAGGSPAAGTKFTRMLLDDIQSTSAGNFQLGLFVWSLSNLNSTAVTALPSVRFYAADGAGGSAGTFLGGINFNGISVPANTVSGVQFNATAQNITLPQNFWAGEFYSFASTVTQAQANNFGMGTFNPVDVGTSADRMFTSTATAATTGDFATNAPVGTDSVSPFGGAPVANFRFEFSAAPEPTSLALIGLVSMGLVSRRRRA
jgi:hypothetical protein